jgi:acyl carrier protein
MASEDCDDTFAMREKILLLIRRETGIEDVTDSTRIEALGIDSLEFVSILQEIRNRIGKVSTKDAVEAGTVGELIAAVRV